jgi:energy-coupling factor transporter ATP-binding protein EcfA2
MVIVKDVYYDGYLLEVLTGFKKSVLKKNTTAVIIIDGRSGMGKTTLGNQLGYLLDDRNYFMDDKGKKKEKRSYNINKIYYEPKKFLEGLNQAKKGDFLMFDEAMIISSRSAMSDVNKMMIMAMSMIRSKQLFICFCVNSIFDLDRNLALSRADLLLHVYGDHLTDRGNFSAFFKAQADMDRIKNLYLVGKKFYSYSKPSANFYGRFGKKFIVDELEYEKRKQVGIDAFLSGTTGKQEKNAIWFGNLCLDLNTNPIKELRLTALELAQKSKASRRSVERRIQEAKLRAEIDEETL